MNRKLSDAKKRQWADPEWAARQRKLIRQGMLESPHVSEAAQRAAKTRANKRLAATGERQPWKPGDPKPEWLRRAGQ